MGELVFRSTRTRRGIGKPSTDVRTTRATDTSDGLSVLKGEDPRAGGGDRPPGPIAMDANEALEDMETIDVREADADMVSRGSKTDCTRGVVANFGSLEARVAASEREFWWNT